MARIKWANPLQLGKYLRVERDFNTFHPLMDWVAVEEDLANTTTSGLVVPEKQHTLYGTVLKLGDRALARHGLQVGDRIVFTEWEGGRWEFADPSRDGGMIRVLLMEADFIRMVIREDEG